jgi:hypothetical protein
VLWHNESPSSCPVFFFIRLEPQVRDYWNHSRAATEAEKTMYICVLQDTALHSLRLQLNINTIGSASCPVAIKPWKRSGWIHKIRRQLLPSLVLPKVNMWFRKLYGKTNACTSLLAYTGTLFRHHPILCFGTFSSSPIQTLAMSVWLGFSVEGEFAKLKRSRW